MFESFVHSVSLFLRTSRTLSGQMVVANKKTEGIMRKVRMDPEIVWNLELTWPEEVTMDGNFPLFLSSHLCLSSPFSHLYLSHLLLSPLSLSCRNPSLYSFLFLSPFPLSSRPTS